MEIGRRGATSYVGNRDGAIGDRTGSGCQRPFSSALEGVEVDYRRAHCTMFYGHGSSDRFTVVYGLIA